MDSAMVSDLDSGLVTWAELFESFDAEAVESAEVEVEIDDLDVDDDEFDFEALGFVAE